MDTQPLISTRQKYCTKRLSWIIALSVILVVIILISMSSFYRQNENIIKYKLISMNNITERSVILFIEVDAREPIIFRFSYAPLNNSENGTNNSSFIDKLAVYDPTLNDFSVCLDQCRASTIYMLYISIRLNHNYYSSNIMYRFQTL